MNNRHLLRRTLATVALTLVTTPSLVVVSPGAGAVPEATGPFRVVGSLPTPNGPPRKANSQSHVIQVDAVGRRLFLLYEDASDRAQIVTYDLRSRIPRQIGIGSPGLFNDFPIANPYTVAYDRKRKNLALVSTSIDADGHHVPAGTGNVVVYSTVTNTVVDRWNILDRLPGYYPMGITHSDVDDRYYTVGEFSGHQYVVDGTPYLGAKPIGPGSGVAAFDAEGTVTWVRGVPECQQVLFSKGIASLVARSRARDALYFACVSGGSPLGQTYPGQAGIVRLSIDADDDTAKAADRAAEFFAISGNYYSGGQGSGVAAFDALTDRFYLSSISFRTPGAWVFDGKLTAWVGFVASASARNYFIGVNEGIGHLYLGTKSGATPSAPTDGVLVADVRQTPVPAGEFTPLVPSNLIVTDAGSNRLFVRPVDANAAYLVVEDLTEVTHGTPSIDDEYDKGTSNTRDTADADVFFAIGATGFAAQTVEVGGSGSPGSALGPASPQDPGGFDGSTRALMLARVGGIDLRESGAAASAQSALPDLNTSKEFEENKQEWPFPNGACLDAGGRPVNQEWRDTHGYSEGAWTITCDLAKKLVKADVRMGASRDGGVSVGRSTYTVTAIRNRIVGAEVKTTTAAHGIAIDVAGGYVVRIGSVSAAAETVAHGRPGTARALWTRRIDGVRVLTATGTEVAELPGCASRVEYHLSKATVVDTCRDLSRNLNRVLPTRLKVDFPMPQVTATPKGAFAGIEQTTGQYFQQQVVNDQGVVYRGDSVGVRPAPAMVTESYTDTTERSRTVTVFAATQANSVFQVNPPFDYGNGPTVTPPLPGGPTTVGPTGPTVGGPVAGPGGPAAPLPPTVPRAPGQNPTAIPTTNVNGYLFMRRNLRDAALLVLLAGLVMSGAGTMWRRRRLVEVLVTVPRKEAL